MLQKDRLKRVIYSNRRCRQTAEDEQMDLESANEQDEERIKVIDEKLEYLRKLQKSMQWKYQKVHMRYETVNLRN